MVDNLKSQNYPVELIGLGKESHIGDLDNWITDNDASVCSDPSPFPTWDVWGASQRDMYVLDLSGNLILQQNITSGIPDDLGELIISLIAPLPACILGEVYVSEAHTSGDPEDYIEIYNSGSLDCSLEGFQLDDDAELDDLTFGNIIISAGGYWVGYEDDEESFSSGLSSSGDIVVFADSSGNSLSVTLEPSEQLDGVQLSQSFDDSGIGCYTIPTPGIQNSDCVNLSVDRADPNPVEFLLHQNYPNPFNPETVLGYFLPNNMHVRLTIYDILGSRAIDLVNENQTSGYKSEYWNGTDNNGRQLPGGVYLYKIQAGNNTQIKKMILLK